MNRAFDLLKVRLGKRGISPAHASPAAEIMCDILDEKEGLWFHDRNRYDERIRKLEAEIARLKAKGQDE